ncbi:hypothetical protein QN277_004995 [Acacia crassicarpa]|uniref:Uncharacterized protein n=2 Tax=Acacia crassicarpa TaxID=499986 RepID=A0AAE1IVR7_9FABA|nr:hypothetical protein QN277_004995 [Acacia crassicarpa]
MMGSHYQLTRAKIRKIFPNTNPVTKAILLRIFSSLVAMTLLLWTIRYGYEAATATGRPALYSQWISRFGALTMFFAFLLIIVGLPIIADLFLRLSEELQYPEESDFQQSNDPKADISV